MKTRVIKRRQPIEPKSWAWLTQLRENEKLKKVYDVNPFAEVYSLKKKVYNIYTESFKETAQQEETQIQTFLNIPVSSKRIQEKNSGEDRQEGFKKKEDSRFYRDSWSKSAGEL